jgi:DNA-binding transcriptional LysR family regulator
MLQAHLSGIDLNLLPLFDALIGERHVTRAGRRVGLSQPAASRGLARLRELVGDPLLVRTATGLVPTPRALALHGPVRAALGLVEGALAPEAPFDPKVARRTVQLATTDYAELVLLPPLVARLGRDAPGIVLWQRAIGTAAIDRLLASDVELVLSPVLQGTALSRGVRQQELFTERFVCIVRRGHPLARGRLTLARYVAARHAFIAPRGRRGGTVDDLLAARGLSREIALATPHFLVAPFAVAESDLVLTVPERVARTYARSLPLAILEPPMELPGFSVSVLWHERTDADEGLAWVRRCLVEASRPARARR